jgi:hypothetical protein
MILLSSVFWMHYRIRQAVGKGRIAVGKGFANYNPRGRRQRPGGKDSGGKDHLCHLPRLGSRQMALPTAT